LEPQEQLAARHIALRERAGLTQEQEAKIAGVSPTTISGIESGKITRPHLKTLLKLARALGADVGELRESGKGEAPPSQGKLFDNGVLEEQRRALLAKPTDDQRAAERNVATDWIEFLELSVAVDNASLSHADSTLDEVLQISEHSFFLWKLCWLQEELLLPWFDENKRAAWEQAERKLEDLFKRIDELIEQKRRAEQERLDQTTLVRLEDRLRQKRERERARAAG
jgi:transcriptional regulator with XRE-family HTH domain